MLSNNMSLLLFQCIQQPQKAQSDVATASHSSVELLIFVYTVAILDIPYSPYQKLHLVDDHPPEVLAEFTCHGNF